MACLPNGRLRHGNEIPPYQDTLKPNIKFPLAIKHQACRDLIETSPRLHPQSQFVCDVDQPSSMFSPKTVYAAASPVA
jgi:hypothetical protein